MTLIHRVASAYTEKCAAKTTKSVDAMVSNLAEFHTLTRGLFDVLPELEKQARTALEDAEQVFYEEEQKFLKKNPDLLEEDFAESPKGQELSDVLNFCEYINNMLRNRSLQSRLDGLDEFKRELRALLRSTNLPSKIKRSLGV
jgi:hypothetical protein